MRRRRARVVRGSSSGSASLVERLATRAPDVMFRVRLSPRPQLEYINHAVLALTGYSPDDWYADAGLGLRIVHPSDRRKLQEIAKARRLPPEPVVLRWVRRNGSPLRTEINAVPVYNRGGALVAIEGVARDVTTTRNDPEGPRRNDRFLRLAFDNVPLGLAHTAPDGRFLHVNRRLCEVTGFSVDELLTRRLDDVADPNDVEHEGNVVQQIGSADLAEATVEKRWICKDGSRVWVRITVTRLGPGSPDSLALVAPASRGGEVDTRIMYAGIEVDTDRLEVRWNAHRVELTLKEVLLLRYLIRHRGEMLARDRLLKDVWGYEHAGRSRTLDVHICRLRRKLPPLTDSLVTIGHFGYTLSQQAGTSSVTAGA